MGEASSEEIRQNCSEEIRQKILIFVDEEHQELRGLLIR